MNAQKQQRSTAWWKGTAAFLLVLVAGVGLACWSVAAEPATEPAQVDEQTGLRIAPGWELVRNNCVVCHSARQFLQQRGSRHTWDSIITWMQQRGGLWKLEPEVRETILDYLVTHHGPKETSRRPAIPATLMPPNPYARPMQPQGKSP